jgi:hypothetical protein
MNIALGCDRQNEAKLDRNLAELGAFSGAQETFLNPMLPSDFVLAASYAKSFTQHAFTVGNTMHGSRFLMSPTCCYPLFYSLTDTKLSGINLFTHKNICFRCEAEYTTARRQGVFLMREYIIFAEELAAVRAWIETVQSDVFSLLTGFGLKVSVEKATDPFFNPTDLRQKFQEEQNLKSEFIVDGLAVGSLNLHLQAMSRNCRITGTDGAPLFTGCFGLGYDRVAGLINRSEGVPE